MAIKSDKCRLCNIDISEDSKTAHYCVECKNRLDKIIKETNKEVFENNKSQEGLRKFFKDIKEFKIIKPGEESNA